MPPEHVEADDDMPPRMKRGNEARPERVPTEGHEGTVPVPEKQWEEHGARKDHADELAEE